MLEKRIAPAIKKGSLTEAELIRVLRDAEEHGNQHIFLHRTPKTHAQALVNENGLRGLLKKIDRLELLEGPALVEEPHNLTLVDARLESEQPGRSVVLKAAEMFTYARLVGTNEEAGGRFFTKRYERVSERTVHVFRVHETGLSELRIHAHDQSITYRDREESLWAFFGPLVDRLRFEEVAIVRAQQNLWIGHRKQLAGRVRYSDSRVRNTSGNVAAFATGGAQSNLFDDPKATASLETFWDEDAVCDRSNLWFLKGTAGNPLPSKDIHIHIAGAVNEFAVPAACSRSDYEYVLEQIRKANS